MSGGVPEAAQRSWEDLVAAAVAGEEVARRDLARLCIARVRLQAVLMGARGADLEAVVRKALEDVFGALATFRAESAFVTWLDRIAARALLGAAAGFRTLPAAVPEGSEGRMLLERATRRLARLDPERRLGLILTLAGGHDPEDVAQVLGGAPAATRARIERARRDLEKDGDEGAGRWLEGPSVRGDDALLDTLTERRLERAAIAALDRAPAAAPVSTARPRRWAWAGLGAAAAAVAGLLVAAVLWPAGPGAARPRLDAVVALAAGGATIAGAPARAGRWIGAGAAFQVPAGGRLALALGDGTLLCAAPGARGGVDAWTLPDARVRLDAGAIVARVPTRSGRRFVVRTAEVVVHAPASATFAVTRGSPTSVRVLRGSVDAEARTGSATKTRIEAREELVIGSGGTRPADPARMAFDWAVAGRGAVAVHGAPIRLETTPPGATLSLDGEPIGRTPVTLLARPGPAHLLVELAGHAPVREEVELRPARALTRHFTLFPLTLRATRPTAH